MNFANANKNVPIRRSSSNVMYSIYITSPIFEEGKRFSHFLFRGSDRHRMVTLRIIISQKEIFVNSHRISSGAFFIYEGLRKLFPKDSSELPQQRRVYSWNRHEQRSIRWRRGQLSVPLRKRFPPASWLWDCLRNGQQDGEISVEVPAVKLSKYALSAPDS